MNENEIGDRVLAAAIEVHRELGPGLYESVYEVCLAHELALAGVHVERQVLVPVTYKALEFDEGFRADLVVEGRVVVELKSVEEVSRAHRKQIQTYLRLLNKQLGYLLNFGSSLMKEGIVRAVNGLVDDPVKTESRAGSLRGIP